MRYENRYYVNPEGLSGGLALWWNNEVEVKVIEAIKNCIDTLVEMEDKKGRSRVCWIYASTDFDERRNQWDYIKKSVEIFDIPWLCIGDFNEIKENGEKKWGRIRGKRRINNFQEFINDCELMEVPFKGQLYTCFNKRESGLVRERLGRALVNMKWEKEFPCT